MVQAKDIKQGSFIRYADSTCKVQMIELDKSEDNSVSVKMKLFNLDTGETLNNSFPADTEIEIVNLKLNEMEFIHKTENSLIFTDEENNEQLEVDASIIGDSISFFQDKSMVNVVYYKGIIASVELPKVMVFDIDFTEDIERDNSNLEYIKDARLTNGHTIRVPAFIKIGDKVRVQIETGEYICRE